MLIKTPTIIAFSLLFPFIYSSSFAQITENLKNEVEVNYNKRIDKVYRAYRKKKCHKQNKIKKNELKFIETYFFDYVGLWDKTIFSSGEFYKHVKASPPVLKRKRKINVIETKILSKKNNKIIGTHEISSGAHCFDSTYFFNEMDNFLKSTYYQKNLKLVFALSKSHGGVFFGVDEKEKIYVLDFKFGLMLFSLEEYFGNHEKWERFAFFYLKDQERKQKEGE